VIGPEHQWYLPNLVVLHEQDAVAQSQSDLGWGSSVSGPLRWRFGKKLIPLLAATYVMSFALVIPRIF
jgi:hypothetical protein